MTECDLRALVTWTVEDPPGRARLADLLGTVVSAAATIGTLGTATGARARPSWVLPVDPDAYVDLGLVRARGTAPWLPGGPGTRHRVQATQSAVLVDAARRRRPPVPLPLTELRVERARPRRAGRPARHATAAWTLTLTGAGTVDVEGPWLALAWIGRLAGWPEPVLACDDSA